MLEWDTRVSSFYFFLLLNVVTKMKNLIVYISNLNENAYKPFLLNNFPLWSHYTSLSNDHIKFDKTTLNCAEKVFRHLNVSNLGNTTF